MSENDSHDRERRHLLKAVAATATIGGFAGCSGDGDTETTQTTADDGEPTQGTTDDGGTTTDRSTELGERVPTITMMYPTSLPEWQDIIPLVKNHVESALDVKVEAKPVDVSKFISDTFDDARTYHYAGWKYNSVPSDFFLNDTAKDFVVGVAGAAGTRNLAQYADCEYSTMVEEMDNTPDLDERASILHDALVHYSEDRVEIPFVSADMFVTIRSDQLNVEGLGEMGAVPFNTDFLMQTTPKSGNRWVYGTTERYAQGKNYLQISFESLLPPWNYLVHSPLVGYNSDRELVTYLAEDYTVDGTSYTFDIHDEAYFHNGDPITAEDAKFTFELLNEFDVPAVVKTFDYESITAVDEKTLEVELGSVDPAFLGQLAGFWGILHKPTWEPMESLEDFAPDTVIGSGPFELEAFTRDQSMTLSPSPEPHPVGAPEHNLVLFQFDDVQARVRAFQQNEVQVSGVVTGATIDRIQNQMPESQVQVSIGEGIGAWKLLPSYARAPVHFTEFQDAVGMAIDRREINQVVAGGRSTEIGYSCPFYLTNHPQVPPEDELYTYTDDVSGDTEGARQVLADNGWGWGDNGNLRYPADKDTSPLWPQGEAPSPEDFPCLEE